MPLGTFTTPRGTPVEMVYREGTNDWNTLTSCLTEDEYHLRDRTLSGWAVDIGAYIGGVTVALAVDNPDLRVLAIEPVPANVALLRQNVERNGVADRVEIIESAVGDGFVVSVRYGFGGSEIVEHHAFVGNSTLAHAATVSESVEYDSLTLEDVLAHTGPVDLLKIDIEGGEYDFFASARLRDLERVPVIVGEWHNNDGHVQTDIADILGQTHRITFSGPVAGPGGFLAERGR